MIDNEVGCTAVGCAAYQLGIIVDFGKVKNEETIKILYIKVTWLHQR